MKVLIIQFLFDLSLQPSSIQIFSSAPCSQTPSVCVIPLMWDQVSYPHKATGKDIGLYILIFVFSQQMGTWKIQNSKVAR
jgi:hypothetical protein